MGVVEYIFVRYTCQIKIQFIQINVFISFRITVLGFYNNYMKWGKNLQKKKDISKNDIKNADF